VKMMPRRIRESNDGRLQKIEVTRQRHQGKVCDAQTKRTAEDRGS